MTELQHTPPLIPAKAGISAQELPNQVWDERRVEAWWSNYVWPLIPPTRSNADMMER